MNRKCSAQVLVLLLAVVALTVTACKETNSVASAQTKVDQAKQQLASAKSELAAAKSANEKADASSDADSADEPAAQQNVGADAATQSPEPDPPAATHDSAKADNKSIARQPPPTTAPKQVCADCGTISAIEVVQSRNGPPEYVGTIVGGVVGAALGHQIGDGSGQTIATIVGAVGGALAGHETQQRMTGQRAYRVTIRMDAGGNRAITVPSAKRISEGMRVHVRGNNIVLMGGG